MPPPKAPKTPDEAAAYIRNRPAEKHHIAVSDVMCDFVVDTTLARCFLRTANMDDFDPEPDDTRRALCQAASYLASAIDQLKEDIDEWEIYREAVALVGGWDKARQIKMEG